MGHTIWRRTNKFCWVMCGRSIFIIIIIIIIIIKHVLIKVTLSCQRHCMGTAQSLTRRKEQAEVLTAGGRRQTIVDVRPKGVALSIPKNFWDRTEFQIVWPRAGRFGSVIQLMEVHVSRRLAMHSGMGPSTPRFFGTSYQRPDSLTWSCQMWYGNVWGVVCFDGVSRTIAYYTNVLLRCMLSFLSTVGHSRVTIAQFAITINSNVCPHIRFLNTLMRESYAWRHRNTLFPEHIRQLYCINYGHF